jgi:hypothetical protein
MHPRGSEGMSQRDDNVFGSYADRRSSKGGGYVANRDLLGKVGERTIEDGGTCWEGNVE